MIRVNPRPVQAIRVIRVPSKRSASMHSVNPIRRQSVFRQPDPRQSAFRQPDPRQSAFRQHDPRLNPRSVNPIRVNPRRRLDSLWDRNETQQDVWSR
jgi:hypothetical protein